MAWVLRAAFFVSGASALAFEIAWVRQLGLLFGSTTHSAAVVTGVFVLGLGAGAEVAGRVADRLARGHGALLVRGYAALEVFIAAWGLALAALLPRLADTPFPPSSYSADARGWHAASSATYLAQVVVAALLIAPPALAMGGTLVLLVRSVLRSSLERVAASTSVLYAVNTAGAAVGALVVDLALVPALGVSGAQGCAAALNLTAALLAILSARGARDEEPEATGDGARAVATPARHRGLAAAVLLAGLTGMALEIIWFRYLSGMLGAHRATLSLILAVILVGIWVGSLAFGHIAQRTRRPLLVFASTQVLLAVSAAGGALVRPAASPGSGFLGLAVPVLTVVGVPALCLGTSFPLANAAMQADLQQVGRRAGRLYLANTAGGMCGTLLAGFVLIPTVGMQHALTAVLVLVGVTLAVLAPGAWREATTRRTRAGLVAGVACAALAIAGFTALPARTLLERIYDREEVGRHAILYAEGLTESIAVTERTDLAKEPQRVLYVNGVLMSGTVEGAQRYMRAMAHIPLLQIAAPKRVLVICFGVGNTANAMSLHPIEQLDIADLSKQILEHGHLFTRWNGGVLDDPRTRVFVHDGRQHLRMQAPDTYDLVTLEPPPLAQAGVGALYAREFYALARSRLRTGGFVTQWLPAYQVRADAAVSMVRAFLDVFPDAVLVSGYARHLILMGRKDAPNQIDPDELRARLHERPRVRADLARVSLASPRAIVGAFVADGQTMARATAGAPAASDDWPVNEYTFTLWPRAGQPLPPELFDVSRVEAWCPRCFAAGAVRPEVDGLTEQLRFLGAWYATDNYRQAVGAPPAPPMAWVLPDPDGALGRVVRADGYLSHVSAGAPPAGMPR